MRQKMTAMVISLCTVILGSGLATNASAQKAMNPLGAFDGQVTVPEYGGVGAFTVIGVLGIVAVTLYRKLYPKATRQE